MLTWNEMRNRATIFAREWKDEKRETGEYQSFWNDFFDIFGIKRRSVAIYQQQVEKLGGGRGAIDLFQPSKLIAEHKSAGKDLDEAFAQAMDYAVALPEDIRPRYIIVTDYAHMRLCDLEGEDGKIEKHEFPLAELPKHIRHFAFIPGYEVRKYREQDPVNRKAVRVVVNLYQTLAKSNYPREHLGHLLVRLVFCFFADDAGVFPPGEPFKYYLALGSNEDGSDFGARLDAAFSTLNTPEDKRQTTLGNHLAELPYVNGGLFADYLPVVFFDHEMRRAVLDACEFNWSAVSPEIFGSMFQFVLEIDPGDLRHDFGAHYTSEKNILKVIDGLFMDDLRAELSVAGKNTSKLNALWEKIGRITLLDPACGCGNFLVVAYRELRRLELEILKRLHPHVASQVEGGGQTALPIDIRHLSKLSVERMYGIELLPFPAEIAKLSLWLTDHLANKELGDYFGVPFVKLPLTERPHIVKGNALTTDWESVVPKGNLSYILGNPPFISKQDRDDSQKNDMALIFGKLKGAGELDYVTAWYEKAINYIQDTRIQCAFVSTNSIIQGEQAGILWPNLFEKGVKISFAHRTFKWSNEAPGKAAVFCVIIGFDLYEPEHRYLFDYVDPAGEPHGIEARNINPYLVDAPDIVVTARRKPLSDIPPAVFGSMPNDTGQFLFEDAAEKDAFIAQEPGAAKFIRPLLSAKEYLQGGLRYCLWLKDASPEELRALPLVMRRVETVRMNRETSTRATTKALAETPYLFGEDRQPSTD
ncbi:class I SAM-dependent DNA methyltransferase [Candidatus Poribacteria bacterium]|nr:class I SAM-dependent DNA methyltransferase [Candidatus Poribacteria bacterium]